MFGYACDETDELMPLPICLAHRMAERLAEVRRAGTVPYLRPDGKTQVTFDYEDGKPVRLRTVLISTQHNDGIDRDEVIRPDLIEHVIRPVVPAQFADDDYEVLRQPDRPLRASAAPTATPASPAARSSSTPTAAWAATAAAPSRARTRPRSTARPPTPPAGWPRTWWPPAPPTRCEVQVAYAIGVAQPGVDHGGDLRHRDRWTTPRSSRPSTQVFDLRPAAIIRDLDLRRPIYSGPRPTATSAGRPTTGFTLGAHRQGRRPALGARAVTLPFAHRSEPGPRRARRPPCTAGRSVRGRPRRWCGCCPTAGHRQDVRLPGPRALWRPGARRHDGARRPCTAAGSAAGWSRSTSSRPPG